jgi:phenylacetate-CoA ligase
MGTAHALASRGLMLPLVQARRAIRPSRRRELVAFRRGMRFRADALTWDVAERRAWLLERLRFVVRRAALETTYYNELFARVGFDPEEPFGFEDFARLPVLERADVHSAGADLVSHALAPEELVKQATGGSTGAPTEVWAGPEERGWGQSGVVFPLRQIGVRSGASTAFFWGHHLDPTAGRSIVQRLHDFEANVRWFDCFRISSDILEAYHRAFQRWRPACIVAYASALAALAEHVAEQRDRPTYPALCFVTGAEKLLPAQRETIEAVFGRPVHERYGSRDAGPIGFQLDPRMTLDYTVDWANIFVEPETDDEESPILITKLHADGMAMLRYRIGDIGRFPADSSSGHPSFVMHAVVGREIDRIALPDGRWVSGAEIPHMMKDYPVREFMFFQREDYSVEIQVAPRHGFDEASRAGILRTVGDNLPGVRVDLLLVESVTRASASKLRPVVSEGARGVSTGERT